MEDDNSKIAWIIEGIMPLIVVGIVFSAPAVIGLQIYWFLKFGTWTPLTVRDGLDFALQQHWEFSWLGVEEIAKWMPLSGGFLILSLIVYALILWAASEYGKAMEQKRKTGRF